MDANLKTNKTLVFVVLDRSGSMSASWDETISGFNSYINKLKEDDKGDYLATLIQFDAHNGPQMLLSYENTPVAQVPALDSNSYQPRGYTPLFDAIGESVRRAKPGDDRSVTMVIITDGMENASTEFTQDSVKKLIAEKEAEGWTFVFLGANIDAYQVGASIGTQAGSTSNYQVGREAQVYAAVATSTMARTHANATVGTLNAMGMKFFDDSQKVAMGDTVPDPGASSVIPDQNSNFTITVDPASATQTLHIPSSTVHVPATGGGPAAGRPFPAAKRPRKGVVRNKAGWTVTGGDAPVSDTN